MISICIVNWNTRDLLRNCLKAIDSHPPVGEYEIIVVDNASPDASAQMVKEEFPRFRLLANSENLLYAKASNQALAMARGELVMLLNPDTEVKEGCLARLSEFLQNNPQAAAAAPRLRWPDGSIQPSCRSFPKPRAILMDILRLSRVFPGCEICGEYRMTFFPHDSLREVDQPMASALMLKREALEEIGGFDEGFPMFFNDVDLCFRLRQAGWKIFFLPEAEALHHYGSSTAQRKREMIAQSHESLLRFYRKHYRRRVGGLGYWTVILLSRAGRCLRLFAAPKRNQQ